ncbi:unnamed protein product [Candidula unifasciata]|uniref:TROVE domain-containing protein n=1 Tax=Candidula unifasciata TaxID=100452 RepID=A0A8S4A454_9EUPU|nr:unnamed protein product [Candidula unifasciata]
MSLDPTNDLDYVTRFVCIGSEEGCHSILPKQDYRDKVPSLHSLLSRDAAFAAIRRLRTIFENRSFVTKDPLLFALAMIVRKMPEGHDEDPVRHGAYDLVQEACESPLDLFTFVSFDKAVSGPGKAGWGRGMKRLVRHWYESKAPLDLAFEATKCKSSHGWSHRDLIRQSHIHPNKRSKGASVVLNYLAKGKEAVCNYKEEDEDEEEEVHQVVAFLRDVEKLIASKAENKELIRDVIERRKLVDRQIPSHLFQMKETFEGLLGHMELANIFRSIPKMASLGMLDHAAPEASKVIEYVGDFDKIKQQKVPPVVIFVALRRYETNKAKKWVKNHNLVKALHAAFNASLKCLPRIGKRTLLAVHIDSKIAKRRVSGANFLTPLMPCALMAKFFTQSETRVQVVYFHQKVIDLKIENNKSRKMPMAGIIEQIVKPTKELANANFDLSEPLKWATQNRKSFDNILIMSDKKTVTSTEAFYNALHAYRMELSLPAAKLAFIGMSDHTVIGNKLDLNMLEVSGFNERVPQLIYNFFCGNMDFSGNDITSTEAAAAP